MDGFTTILQEEYAAEFSPPAQRYLELVHQNAQQMGRLVDDLLDFCCRAQTADFTDRLAGELARQALEILEPELNNRQVEIIFVHPDGFIDRNSAGEVGWKDSRIKPGAACLPG